MTKYLFTGEVPMIFANLSHGPNVTVEHAHPVFASPDGVEVTLTEPDGATVTLYPGDTVTVPDNYPEHAYLQPFEAKTKKTTATKATISEGIVPASTEE